MRNIGIICLVVCLSIATSLSGAELESHFEDTPEYVIHTALPSLADEISSFENPGVFFAPSYLVSNDRIVIPSHPRSTPSLQEFPPPQNPKVVLIVLGVAVAFLAFVYILFH